MVIQNGLSSISEIMALASGLQNSNNTNKLISSVTEGLQQDAKHKKLMNKIQACKELAIPFKPTTEQEKIIHDSITKDIADL